MAERKPLATQQPVKKETVFTTATATKTAEKPRYPLFERDNYMWMIIGAVVVAIGMFLMAGGKTTDPNQFDYKQVYSTTRVTIAPILILLGLAVEIYAIFKRPKAHL